MKMKMVTPIKDINYCAPTNELIFNDDKRHIQLYIKREDRIHPYLSGNKYRKLKYNILETQKLKQDTLLTFGGAFSNHIAACAYAGKANGLKTVGIIRGEELKSKQQLNPTLRFAKSCGMQLIFISREAYKRKATPEYLDQLRLQLGDFYLIPEGGSNALGVKGCEEILGAKDLDFDYICCSVGTGGTIAGLINSSSKKTEILGFPALKNTNLEGNINKFVYNFNWKLISDDHFGGYGKVNSELVTFINRFKIKYNIQLDPIYTGKMMFGILDLIQKDHFKRNSKILAIHTGGLQGIEGVNQKLKRKNLPLIQT